MIPQKLGKPLSIAVLALMIIQVFAVTSLSVPSVYASATVVVPDNYATIGEAVANAAAGDTILVKAGTYNENFVIDKPLSLISEEVGAAIIVGAGGLDRGTNPVVNITADNVVVSGFVIRSNTNYSSTSKYATGIKISANNCTLMDNDISSTYYGVFSSFTAYTTIVGNNVTGAIKDGIRICGGHHNTLTNNAIDNNAVSGLAIDGYLDTITYNSFVGDGRGIGLGASYCVFFGNNLTANEGFGLYLGGSHNIIASNILASNVWGVYLTSDFAAPNNNTFYDNSFVNNTADVVPNLTSNVEVWDNGSTGNYWSDYTGTDLNGDGIGDTPYTVYVDNVDEYPLMHEPATPDVVPQLPTATPVNGVVARWNFDEVEPNGVTPDTLNYNPVIVETNDGVLVSPSLVSGYEGNALRFNGSDYAYVSASPTLDISGEFTIDTWINVQEFKAVTYNAIIEECARTMDTYPTRVFGLAFNGVPPQSSSELALGVVRGFFLDNNGVFNEIVTTQDVLPLNQWVHVVFVRSFATGMHIYVDGIEQTVIVTSGSQNPTSTVAGGNEFYIGHDSMSTLDNLEVSTTAMAQPAQTMQPTSEPTIEPTPEPTPLWGEWWLWIAVACVVVAVLAGGVWLSRRSSKPA